MLSFYTCLSRFSTVKIYFTYNYGKRQTLSQKTFFKQNRQDLFVSKKNIIVSFISSVSIKTQLSLNIF